MNQLELTDGVEMALYLGCFDVAKFEVTKIC